MRFVPDSGRVSAPVPTSYNWPILLIGGLIVLGFAWWVLREVVQTIITVRAERWERQERAWATAEARAERRARREAETREMRERAVRQRPAAPVRHWAPVQEPRPVRVPVARTRQRVAAASARPVAAPERLRRAA